MGGVEGTTKETKWRRLTQPITRAEIKGQREVSPSQCRESGPMHTESATSVDSTAMRGETTLARAIPKGFDTCESGVSVGDISQSDNKTRRSRHAVKIIVAISRSESGNQICE